MTIINNIIIKIINHVLNANNGAKHKLSQYQSYSFNIITPLISIVAIINDNGNIAPISGQEEKTIIKIPAEIIADIITQDKISMYKKIDITGDTQFAKTLLQIFAELNWDIYVPENQISILLFNQIKYIFEKIKDHLILLSKTSLNSSTDYLIKELQIIITQAEHEKFYQQVENLASKVEIISKQINDIILNERI